MGRTNDVVRVYRDAAGEWRWRRRAGSGEIVATSGEGYEHYSDCKREAEELNPDALIAVTRETEHYRG